MTVLAIVVVGLVLVFGFVVFWGAPYVPSRLADVGKALDELYSVGADDLLVDIGSGDGLVLRAAARRGARAVGYELNPILVLISRWLNRSYSGISVRFGNFWKQTVPDQTTVIYVFGESRDIEKMASWADAQATRLGRELYLLSYGFALTRPALRSHRAFHLYRINPLQTSEKPV